MTEKTNLRFLIEAIQKNDLSLLMIASVADAISADARFNEWMMRMEKVITADNWFALLEKYDELYKLCSVSIEKLSVIEKEKEFIKNFSTFCSGINNMMQA